MASKYGPPKYKKAAPLKDRLFNNKPDSVKSEILREASHGWTSPKNSTPSLENTTVPLRINGKTPTSPLGNQEDSIGKQNNLLAPHQSQVGRRTSNTYKRLKTGNLVSQSPFLRDGAQSSSPGSATPSSRVPTPVSRKVSGEKRPRPLSATEDEMDESHASKRERRESKAFTSMVESKNVTNSRFRRSSSSPGPDSPPAPTHATLPSTPNRSNLVSKRLHGPRGAGTAEKRKTVTFDEECDVVVFEDGTEEGQISFRTEEDATMEDESDIVSQENTSYESVQDSIAGMVDSMIKDSRASAEYSGEFIENLAPQSNHETDALTAEEMNEDVDFVPMEIGRRKKLFTHERSFDTKQKPSLPSSDSDPFFIPPMPALSSITPLSDSPHHSPLHESLLSFEISHEDIHATTQKQNPNSSIIDHGEQGPADDLLDSTPPQAVYLTSTPPKEIPAARLASPSARLASQSSPKVSSPLRGEVVRPEKTITASSSNGSLSSGGRAPRINKEDVHRRLQMISRSDSPSLSNSDPSEVARPDRMSSVGALEMLGPTLSQPHQIRPRPMSSPLPKIGLGFPSTYGGARVNDSIQGSPLPSPGPVSLEDVNMRSALDRLVDDFKGEDSAVDEVVEESFRTDANTDADDSKDNAAMDTEEDSGSPPPPLPPKDNIRAHENAIIEQRRAARRAEFEFEGDSTQDASRDTFAEHQLPSRRRSRSTGDVRAEASLSSEPIALPTVHMDAPNSADLEESIQQELRKLGQAGNSYHVKEHKTVYASSDGTSKRLSHHQSAGDLETGKIWKAVKRPSDMNEYSKQIKEYRAQEKPAKTAGKVFVRILGVRDLNVPLPAKPTSVSCTLNNGIHFVSTPEGQLTKDCRIEQEFELIEHKNLEFTLTLKIKNDPHIASQIRAVASAVNPVVSPAPAPSRGAVRAFFSPKKQSSKHASLPPMAPIPDNLARYMKQDGSLGSASVKFSEIADRCDTRLLSINYPLIGQRLDRGGTVTPYEVGEIQLQLFRMPPLVGVKASEMPQSLEECHRGLRHIKWHKQTYHEGKLTQNGGDCTTWRRRQLRIVGAKLIAYNDITKKVTATIDLAKAISVEDDQGVSAESIRHKTRQVDDYDDRMGGVERSFRLLFPENEEIVYYADTDEDKAKWLEILRALVGHVPPRPLWAELLWEREEDLRKQAKETSDA